MRIRHEVGTSFVLAGILLLSPRVALPDGVLSELPPNLMCVESVESQLRAWHATGEMFAEPPAEPLTQAWRLPTGRLGEWIFVQVGADHAAMLVKMHPAGLTQVTFGESCRRSLTTRAIKSSSPSQFAFTNEDLANLFAKCDSGIIYLWSPHMPLSADGYAQAAEAANRLGLAITAVLDPRAEPEYAASVAKSKGIPQDGLRPLLSSELLYRNAALHAPSLLVYRNGRVVGLATPGYRDSAAYQILIGSYLNRKMDR